ncbi:MAG TPA: hypothetical protein VH165_23990 [Kofleriaceae bacterium]|jgi:hypothetical protein|nr:hypothetical protein [Kofleriaceae bacterium]
MGFQFAETMAGTVEWDRQPGVQHPFSFEITAEAASTRSHMKDGKATLHGVIHAPPVADAAPAEGVITIRPVGQRIIRYELQFPGTDGRHYELVGQKDIRWLDPIRTFTYLPAEIIDDDHRRVGVCRTSFDLAHHWWSFLRSFRRL